MRHSGVSYSTSFSPFRKRRSVGTGLARAAPRGYRNPFIREDEDRSAGQPLETQPEAREPAWYDVRAHYEDGTPSYHSPAPIGEEAPEARRGHSPFHASGAGRPGPSPQDLSNVEGEGTDQSDDFDLSGFDPDTRAAIMSRLAAGRGGSFPGINIDSLDPAADYEASLANQAMGNDAIQQAEDARMAEFLYSHPDGIEMMRQAVEQQMEQMDAAQNPQYVDPNSTVQAQLGAPQSLDEIIEPGAIPPPEDSLEARVEEMARQFTPEMEDPMQRMMDPFMMPNMFGG
jgi:hypothetical protein